jgi:hypothetical protein
MGEPGEGCDALFWMSMSTCCCGICKLIQAGPRMFCLVEVDDIYSES